MRQPASAEEEAETKSGHAEACIGSGDAARAGAKEIRSRAEIGPMGERQCLERSPIERLQQLFDANEAKHESRLIEFHEGGQVKAGAEVSPLSLQHEQTRSIFAAFIDLALQSVDQRGAKRVPSLRPIQCERGYRIGL